MIYFQLSNKHDGYFSSAIECGQGVLQRVTPDWSPLRSVFRLNLRNTRDIYLKKLQVYIGILAIYTGWLNTRRRVEEDPQQKKREKEKTNGIKCGIK